MTDLKQAKQLGLSVYDEGKHCKIHGPCERRVSTNYCILCEKQRGAVRRANADRDLLRKQDRERYYRKTSVEEWIQRTLANIRRRARDKNIPFDLTTEHLISLWTGICPVFNIPLKFNCRRTEENNPSDQATVDRIKPELGYVQGNVIYISNLANRIKNDATADQIRRVADWLLALEAR